MRSWTQWMGLPHCLICNLLKKDRVDHNSDRLFFTHRREVIFMEWLFFGIGILLGMVLDVVIMCMLQINRTCRFEDVYGQ